MTHLLFTRFPRKAGSFVHELQELLPGTTVACAPILEAVAVTPEDWDATAFSLIRGEYSWVTFTSVNGVLAFDALAAELGQSTVELLGAAQVAAVGTATGKALEVLGVLVDFVPEEQSAAGMVAEWPLDEEWEDPTEVTVLLVQGLTASPTLEAGLTDYGYTALTLGVYDMQTYPAHQPLVERTEEDAAALDLDAARDALASADVLVATSPLILSTLAEGYSGQLPPTVTIGAATEAAAREMPTSVRPVKISAATTPAPADLAAAVADLLDSSE